MQLMIQLPKAFSVRDDHEFYTFQHVMARLNPHLRVRQVATGVHVDGGCTVFWGLIYAEGQKVGSQDLQVALDEAGFDFKHNGPIHKLELASSSAASA
jgi:hypothetical protein